MTAAAASPGSRIWSPEAEAAAPRLFADEADIAGIGEGLLARTLPKARWTHEAHIAATLWLLTCRPDILPERDLPGIIRAYNEAVGGVNDDTQGYHETVTQLYIAGLRAFRAGRPADEALVDSVNAALGAAIGRRDWPLTYYSRGRLFSREARRSLVAPDRTPWPGAWPPPQASSSMSQ